MKTGFFSPQKANVQRAHRRLPFLKVAATYALVGGLVVFGGAFNQLYGQKGKPQIEVSGQVADSIADNIKQMYIGALKARGVTKIPELTCLGSVPMPSDLNKNLVFELPNEGSITILAEDLQILAKRKDLALTGSDKAYYLHKGMLYVLLKKDPRQESPIQ